MTTMAEVVADELEDIILRRYGITSGTSTYQEMGQEVQERLAKEGYGHVPTALNEAADVLAESAETLTRTMVRLGNGEGTHDDVVRYGAYASKAQSTAVWLRARATETGGTT
jgi:glycerol dehydrogenase-like iron-containing ADH family enzyme